MSDPINYAMFVEADPVGQEKAMLDLFINEYMKDFIPEAAALRTGFNHAYAQHYGPAFMLKPYVAREIARRKAMPPPQTSEEVRLQEEREKIANTYLRAMENGPYQVRVAAAKGLSQLRGFDQQPDKTADALEKLVDTFKEAATVLPD